MEVTAIFERDFCDLIEYQICRFFEQCKRNEIKGYWCDGVIFETMLDQKTACFTAFVGKNGQERFKLFLHLGNISSLLYEQCNSLQSCVPEVDKENTFNVDITRKQMNIYLR